MTKLNPREIAVKILCEINDDQAYSNFSLQEHFSQYTHLNTLDKAFITEMVNGTVRHMSHIDYVINQFSITKTNKMKPLILSILRVGVYQILFMSKVPVSAACNEAVKIAKKRGLGGLSGFVNGVLRTIARNMNNISYPDRSKNPIEYICVKYSYPKWIIRYWLEYYSIDFIEELCSASNKNPQITVRCNLLRTNKDTLMELLAKENVKVSPGVFLPEAIHISQTSAINDLASFNQGLFQVQDESSMLVGHILDPKPGEKILDVCAAPGGKATHCGELMNNQGQIFARDIHEHKLTLIRNSAKRLGIEIITTELYDATILDKEKVCQMDRVMIDAPCSGLGIIRKKPDIKWKKSSKDIDELVSIQRKILSVCSQYVKPGGVLIYSTCTISEKENLENINWFIQNFDFDLDTVEPYIPETLYCDTSKKGYIQLFPNVHNCDGFFIARLKRKR
ncbi:16S rRNA (cytosine(967)-C(5))-methyltransferase RsmB [Defluviitalea raffinosedens]|jgi:16S rRNA (cytosine967-C5)-methyltransferase|uniref:16S rRNA (cytosine(967)-C(5))-methyltransferase n=1 Tax=Defluviitalea raffinosedens TaxID=1450156 RepID=A0A7C8LLB8_9FIRM|nr:16S rRNA (cytosine(967)-C(5))-methyltransferase RsmB [Defluviitalea raffinosedens]KAE9637204.1 16S rRNA (cytosine(967)-C(5))-methyltransferase RsmB [Defluviitalea raffinosedens]MBM7685502.1 16S rRNA (cytosine967-C5)-methyltransferase [Defluviitalea raffinosedens]HHW66769.1 16S rRNA (cytosine(967)-C(5))-methyltransferase RsmB [Candidatus Epulonipiscium sp.]